MAKCPNPECRNGWVNVYMPDGIWSGHIAPCPRCGGAYGEVSCCSGPEGDGTELPSDPNERSGST